MCVAVFYATIISMQAITITATCAVGLEATLKRELIKLGFDKLQTADGRVSVQGKLEDICRLNLWLRTAGRVFIEIAYFEAFTFDELFEGIRNLPWENWIGKDDYFPVSKISARKSEIFSKSDSQAVVKKAVVERLRSHYRVHDLPESSNATVSIRIQIENDMVRVSLDTSGESLSKRGYRAHMDIAPLRETLAAGLLSLAHFDPSRDALLDPMCGSGTILIEAGLMAKNIAPGLNRRFAAENWKILSKAAWSNARLDAKSQIKHDAEFRILGSDTNYTALNTAKENISLAGLDNIFVQKLDIVDLGSRYEKGKLITNPPYGIRLNEEEEAIALYHTLGKVFREKFPNWKYYIITPYEDFEHVFGKRADAKRKLFNGPIRCDYYQYFR